MELVIYRLAVLLGTTPARLYATIAADEREDWLAYLNDPLH